jgi:hypothetical protein
MGKGGRGRVEMFLGEGMSSSSELLAGVTRLSHREHPAAGWGALSVVLEALQSAGNLSKGPTNSRACDTRSPCSMPSGVHPPKVNVRAE